MSKNDDMADIISIRRTYEQAIYKNRDSIDALDMPYPAWLLEWYAAKPGEDIKDLVCESLLEIARLATREYVVFSKKTLAHLYRAAAASRLSDFSFYGPWLFSEGRLIWTAPWLDPCDQNPYKIAIKKLEPAADVVGGDFYIYAVKACAYVADDLPTETDVRTSDTKLFARYVDRCLINTYTPSIVGDEWVPNRKELGLLRESLLKIYGVTNQNAIKELTIDINRILHPKSF